MSSPSLSQASTSLDASSLASRSAKRAREASQMSSDHSQPSSRFWFDDGSLILIAGATKFKIHRSLIAARSSVLTDMLEIGRADLSVAGGQRGSGPDSDGDTPCVTLEDNVNDWEACLQLFYPTL